MSLKVKYIDAPVGAQEAASVEGQGQPFSVMPLVASGANDIAYATLEPEGWPLDGSRHIMPEDVNTGFWSTSVSVDDSAILGRNTLGGIVLGESTASARFDIPPVITVKLKAKHTATGISITFSPSTEEWCTEVCVKWYDGTTLKAQEKTQPTNAHWTIQRVVDGFDSVILELQKTNRAGHFAKIQKIEIGQTHWFSEEEITSVHIVNEVDPSLSELTVDTMQIDIQDRQELSLLPQENQKIELYRNGKLYAAHYISSYSRESKQHYSFSCQSAIGLLDDDYLGGIYENTRVDDILNSVLDGFSYSLNNVFKNSTITGYLPVCTRREALQQICFAIGAVVTTQGSNVINIDPLPVENSVGFARSDIFQGGKVETSPRVAKVEALAHKYSEADDMETLLNDETISGNNVLFTFNEPHHTYEITGGTITGSGANWVTITAGGKVTLTGKKYLHSTVHHIRRNADATVSEQTNAFVVEDATLIHSGNVANVLKRLYTISQLRQTLTQEVAVSSQQASGKKVTSVSPWGYPIQGYITAMESDLTPTGHTASVTILGTEPKADAQYSGQLYSGDMEGLY